MTVLKKPKFKDCFHVEIVEPESVFLLSEGETFLLNEYLYKLLVPLIDGNHTVEEIVDKVFLHLPPEKVSFQNALNISVQTRYMLMKLEQMGYIVESDEYLSSTATILCDRLNINPQKAYNQLQKTKVAVKIFGDVATSEFTSTLEALQIKVSEEADIDLVFTDNYLREGLDAFNQQALKFKRPWMLVKPVGATIWLGPIFYPGKTGCWACLAQRLRGNLPFEEFIQRHKNISTPLPIPLGSLSSTLQTALGMAATEIFKWIVQEENKHLEGILVTYDTLSLNIQNHILVKRPQCPSCGEPELNSTLLPIILGNRKKNFTTDGGHRYCLPEETLQKYQHHISPITGVVRKLEKIFQGLNGLTHTYVAKHHFASVFDDLNSLHQNVGGRSAGKGRTDVQAKVSGFCEAIERYSGVFQGDEIRQTRSYREMKNKAIHPNACMNFSQAQYKNREEWNKGCSSWFQWVPEPFDEEREIEWTPVWSLTCQEFKYLPTAYCYYGYPNHLKSGSWADSNGCAAGNTLEEAILQGFMELVERDSVALWWYNRVRRPRVNLDSFDEPYFQALKEYYQNIHRDLWVLDITSNLNIPAFAAISVRTDREVKDIILGYGAHFDPKIAVQRALTEVNQILPVVLSANADGSTRYTPSSDRLAIDWWKTATLENQPYLFPDQSTAPKVCADYPILWSKDLLDDVITCKDIAETNGMEMLVLNQTRLDIGLKVVKVIVPGMRHFWKRLGAGRLYEVPVQLGWLKESLQENQLNPFPMWM